MLLLSACFATPTAASRCRHWALPVRSASRRQCLQRLQRLKSCELPYYHTASGTRALADLRLRRRQWPHATDLQRAEILPPAHTLPLPLPLPSTCRQSPSRARRRHTHISGLPVLCQHVRALRRLPLPACALRARSLGLTSGARGGMQAANLLASERSSSRHVVLASPSQHAVPPASRKPQFPTAL